jgi:hypothetical protein
LSPIIGWNSLGDRCLKLVLNPTSSNCKPDPDIARGILDRCLAISPELRKVRGQIEILRHGVGLRPTRVGGIRLEAESICKYRPSIVVQPLKIFGSIAGRKDDCRRS